MSSIKPNLLHSLDTALQLDWGSVEIYPSAFQEKIFFTPRVMDFHYRGNDTAIHSIKYYFRLDSR